MPFRQTLAAPQAAPRKILYPLPSLVMPTLCQSKTLRAEHRAPCAFTGALPFVLTWASRPSLVTSSGRRSAVRAFDYRRRPIPMMCDHGKSAGNDQAEVQSTSEVSAESGAARQLLGVKGASSTTSKWKIRLQLMKPVTWIPLIWGVTCGAAASGNYHWNDATDIGKAALCMFLAGPLLTGYTQVINDWYDREIDAINEPYRPIPSGLITESDVKAQVAVLLSSGFIVSALLDRWAGHEWPVNVALTTFGVFIAYIYSAPPLKLKQNGWMGSYALGASYISLPWWAGQAVFGTLDWKTMVLTLFYSFAGLGIAIVNDFKSIEGDRATGMQSLPVMFGIDKAKWITVGTIDIFQLLVAFVLFGAGEKAYAAAIVALVAPQIYLQLTTFLKDPVENDVKYQASAQPFLVLGILVAGLARGHHGPF
jgi:chlorophyll/bacteriochlorophyll a synthase